jgi:hypothetical protein
MPDPVVAGRSHFAKAAPGYSTVDKFLGADGASTAFAEIGLTSAITRKNERRVLIGFRDIFKNPPILQPLCNLSTNHKGINGITLGVMKIYDTR